MKTPLAICALVLSAVLPMATPVQAADIINTGKPTGGLIGSHSVDATDWIAERFTFDSAVGIGAASVYLLSVDDTDVGNAFTLAIYANNASNLPALDFNQGNQNRLFSTPVAYTGSGNWSGANGLNWALAPGSYWFAIEVDGDYASASRLPVSGLQVPGGTPQLADAVAYYAGTAAGYTTAGLTPADTFGLQVSAVPEPANVLLLLFGLVAVGAATRRVGQ
jgi:hypothetical protein